jgi:tRNA(Ile)-lysidine synthase
MSRPALLSRAGPLTVPFGKHITTLEVGSARLLVAVSGGPDSVALLDLLAGCSESMGLELVVAHVDHGIHPDSALVATQVRKLADEYGLPFLERRLGLGRAATETAARTARHRALEGMRRAVKADFIATAHHADDQVETVLMRALRGSGPAGLAAMACRRGRLIRPLLPFRREDLARHLQSLGRSAWRDPANVDARHLRGWIRTDVLPALRARLPDVERRLERVAGQAALDRAAWDALLDVWPALDHRAEHEGVSVASKGLDIGDRKLLIAILMAIGRRSGISLGPKRADRVATLVGSGTSGAHVPIGGGWIAELAFGRLGFLRPAAVADRSETPLSGESGVAVRCGWRITWSPAQAPKRQERVSTTAWIDPGALAVRGWRPGDRVRPLGGRGSRLLVRCFQDARIPRSRRPPWPVVTSRGSVVWVPGVCRSDLLVPRAGAEAQRVDAELA